MRTVPHPRAARCEGVQDPNGVSVHFGGVRQEPSAKADITGS
jgi:hypothetical protein